MSNNNKTFSWEEEREKASKIRTVEDITKWLEERAKNDIWDGYYKGLIGFENFDKFALSSGDFFNPIDNWVNDHPDMYDVFGYTGCAEYFLKPEYYSEKTIKNPSKEKYWTPGH